MRSENPIQEPGFFHGRSGEEILEDHLKYETLLAKLSASFIHLYPDQLDAEIQNAQRAVCEYLRVDRSTVWQFHNPDFPVMQLTHLYHPPIKDLALVEPEDNGPETRNEWRIQMPEGTSGLEYIEADKYFPWIANRIRNNQSVIISRIDDLPEEAAIDKEFLRHHRTKASVMIPLADGSLIMGAITFATLDEEKEWPEFMVNRLHVIARIFAHAIARKRLDQTLRDMEEELQARLHEIMELKRKLEWENLYLKEEFKTLNEHYRIAGQSTAIQKVFRQIEQVASTDSHVLITGETGTGKELVAQAIHAASNRKDRIMVKVNCATLPSSLIESELFGREKGAYTDALTRQIGRFEMADGGTIFLDEIGELSVELQVKLLRVLQEGEFERLGGPKTIRVNVRVIAATNRNLVDAVRKGEFRKDLFYRLSVFPIEVPPLREREVDIPLLVWEFIDQFNQRMGKQIQSVPQKTMDRLKCYSWPGNVRELRNTIERAMILSQGDRLELPLLEDSGVSDLRVLTFKEAEKRHILEALQKAGWHIKGPQGAAALLGLKPSTLYTKMHKLEIDRRTQQDVKPS